MKIYFEIEVAEGIYMGYDQILSGVAQASQLKEALLKPKYGNSAGTFGRVGIQFNKHTFLIEQEFIATVLFANYACAAVNILSDKTYKGVLEIAYKDSLTFDFIDGRGFGVRIRQLTRKQYDDENDETIFVSSTDYMIQEIIVPKKEFVEETIRCSEQYIAYLDHFQIPYFHLESWRKSVLLLKEQFEASK